MLSINGAVGYGVIYSENENIALYRKYERVVKPNSEENSFKSVNFANSVWRLWKRLKKQKGLIACAGTPAGDTRGVLFNLREIALSR